MPDLWRNSAWPALYQVLFLIDAQHLTPEYFSSESEVRTTFTLALCSQERLGSDAVTKYLQVSGAYHTDVYFFLTWHVQRKCSRGFAPGSQLGTQAERGTTMVWWHLRSMALSLAASGGEEMGGGYMDVAQPQHGTRV